MRRACLAEKLIHRSRQAGRSLGNVGQVGLLLLVSWQWSSPPLQAHPISVTEGLVRVSREQTDVRITVFLEDLYLFHDLAPNERDFLPLDAIRRGADLHRKFLMKRFLVRDAAGVALKPEFVSLEQPDLPQGGVPLAELMSHKLAYQFRYKTPTAPSFLTISQHLIDAEVSIPAEMRLVIKQAGSGVAFKAALTSEESHTVRFEWEGKPLAEQPTDEELQNWFERQREETLGITDYSSIYSFLYIEDQEVRHEILMPLRTLSESVTLNRREADFLDVDEQVAARAAIEAYFVEGNPILLDNQAITPRVTKLDFFGVDFKDLAKPAEQIRVSMASGRIGIILTYPVEATPNSLDLTWNRFNQLSYTVQMVVYSDQSAEKKTLSKVGGKNKYQWHFAGSKPVFVAASLPVELKPRSLWSLPLLSMAFASVALCIVVKSPRRYLPACLLIVVAFACWPLAQWQFHNPLQAKPVVGTDDAQRVVEGLIENAYAAFRLRDEQAAYDALALGVDGKLLHSLYIQLRRGLLMRQQGGALARVREIETIAGSRETIAQPLGDERSFCYRLAWTIRGDVEHWGHIHSRTNRYEAIFTVEPRGEYWRLTHLDVLDEKRVQSRTSLRQL